MAFKISVSSLKRFGLYFLIASSSISVLAVVQFLLLDQMPIWNSYDNGMPKYRMIDLTSHEASGRVFAKFYLVEEKFKTSINLSLTMFDGQDASKRTAICEQGVVSAKSNPQADSVALAFRNGDVRVVKAENASEVLFDLPRIPEECEIRDLHWSPDGNSILICTDKQSWLHSMQSRTLTPIAFDSSSQVTAPKRGDCFAYSNKGECSLIEWKSGKQVTSFPIGANARWVTLAPDSRRLAFVVDSELHLRNIATGEIVLRQKFDFPHAPRVSLAFSDDGNSLAILQRSSNQGQYLVSIIDVASQCEVCSQEFEDSYLAGIEFGTDTVWVWSNIGKIYKWKFQAPNLNGEAVFETSIASVTD